MFLLEGLTRWNEDRVQAAASRENSGRKCYSGQDVHTLNELSQHFYRLKLAEMFTSPLLYTGELIGISYLYKQTGKTLQEFPNDPDEHGGCKEEEEEEEEEQQQQPDIMEDTVNEGFDEFSLDHLDSLLQPPPPQQQPLPPPQQQPPLLLPQPPPLQPPPPQQQPPFPPLQPVPSSQSTSGDQEAAVSSSTVSVGADGAPGYQQVVLLARCLVERCRKGYITQAEVEEIVALWQNLPDGDKGPVVYPPRHRSHLTKGRFKKAKSYAPSAAPMLGVESMKRCMVGTGSGPAIWPDTSRLVEAIFIQLCILHPSSRRTMGCLQSRWTLVLRDYNTIRIVVCTHPALKTRTTLQLFEVNQRTLSQW
ncbi:uncharacterized protein LOC127532606 [Acanthochromis polyacanthus]|uniref:uncharacterized protein LOC127532606 n=1 Tax=Acanthochromis polyacanthus TaxID=80966 RepID=UPI002233FC44|nr:uncharacterized protein LOC127532606 [Acanthochromis polyacanthus]